MTAANGRTAKVSILGLYRDPFSPAFSRSRTSGVTVSAALFDKLGLPMDREVTMARAVPGTDPDKLKAAVEAALADYPTQTVYTQEGYKDGITGQIDMLLSMLYALLAMSVIISVFGIVNTLVLSVYERTRELGMLRAIGSSRRQLRRMVRYESVITSAIGGVLGIAVGVVVRLRRDDQVRAGRLRLLGAVPATRRLPDRRRDGRRGGGGAACAAGREDRHPGGHPPRVTDESLRPEVPPLPRGAARPDGWARWGRAGCRAAGPAPLS